MNLPEILYVTSADREYLALGVAKNFTAFKTALDLFEGGYEKYNVLKDCDYVHFPFELAQVSRFLNFSPLLGGFFGIAKPDSSPKTLFPLVPERRLKKNEKEVLLALAEFPEKSLPEIARQLSLSHVTVHQIKKKLLARGFLHALVLPNLKDLGFELLVFTRLKFRLGTTAKQLKEIMTSLRREPCAFVLVQGSRECVILCAFEDYSHYKENSDRYAHLLEGPQSIVESNHRLLLSLPDRKFEHLNIAPMTKKLLG